MRIYYRELAHLPLTVPPIKAQQSIVDVLRAVDDKIELNWRVNNTLEAIARGLFKSWFVDFDPVRAKIGGREPRLPVEIADLFPEDLTGPEPVELPEGWRGASLADYALLNPESWTKSTRPHVIQYVDLSGTKWGRIESVESYEAEAAPSRAQRVLRAGDTIVGTVRPGNGSYALVAEDGLTGSTGFAVLRPRELGYRSFVFLAGTSSENIERLARLADGAAYPAVHPDAVSATEVAMPPDDILKRFAEIVDPLLAKVAHNEKEIHTLGALRDALLPKLISGELPVGVAHEAIGG
jgi:type I restriction enzyme S subunit